MITGSTRELGLAMARQFLSLGDSVVISSRSPAAVQASVAALRAEYPPQGARRRVLGVVADASKHAEVEHLADRASAELGGIVRGLAGGFEGGWAARGSASPPPRTMATRTPQVHSTALG